MIQGLKGFHEISLDRVFACDLYREGLTLGWGFCLCNVKLSLTLSWLISLHGQCMYSTVSPSPDSCPCTWMAYFSFISLSDAFRPQEVLPSADFLDMQSQHIVGSV